MIFDTHTHLNVEEFAGREAEEIALAAEMGVIQMNIVGFDKPTIERALELVDEYEQLYATIGWHPTEAGTYTEEVEAYLLDKLKHSKVVALGEIGLDYHWMTAPKEVQEQVFRRQIQLSKDLDLPFVVHTRDAWKIPMRLSRVRALVLVVVSCIHFQGRLSGQRSLWILV
ncbi:TatD family deoxyribonuclease [Streptococcus pneumoniae]|nr:TatD family deoxyribonuclease [Streptococcus pneumoniae]